MGTAASSALVFSQKSSKSSGPGHSGSDFLDVDPGAPGCGFQLLARGLILTADGASQDAGTVQLGLDDLRFVDCLYLAGLA